MNESLTERIDFLGQTALFQGLSAGELRGMLPDCRPQLFMAREVIFHQGDPGRVLYLVKSGQVRIFVNGLEGHETSVILCGRPGEIFGELAIVDGLPRSATAIAITETILYAIEREQFRYHMRQHPQLALNFMKALSLKLRYNTHQVDSLATLDAERRLARKLLELGQDYGSVEANGVEIKMSLTQSDLASLVGTSRESINKILRSFRDRDLISLQNNVITIHDVAALREQVAG